MISRWYPNLELAQAKSSLKYRIGYQGDDVGARPKSDRQTPSSLPPPSRRHHHVPAMHHLSEDARGRPRADGEIKAGGQIVGRRRRRGDHSPGSLEYNHFHRSDSLGSLDNAPTIVFLGDRCPEKEVDSHGGSCSPPHSPTMARRLQTIDHIIARAEDRSISATGGTLDDGTHWQVFPVDHGEMLVNPSDNSRRRSSSKLQPLDDPEGHFGGNAAPQSSRVFSSPHVQRKMKYLMKQTSPGKARGEGKHVQKSSRPTQQRRQTTAVGPNREVSARYLITSADEHGDSPLVAATLVQQASQRQLNNAKVMEFVDRVNCKPRANGPNPLGAISLDKQLRRISLVSFEQGDRRSDERRMIMRTDSTLALRRKQMFGIYSIREVMAVIRLFWFLDADRSGGITLDELCLHRRFFEQLGHSDVSSVFQELDVDGNGTIALNELLKVCFRHANDHQLQAMLTLAKVGNVKEYLTGRHSAHLQEQPITVKKVGDQATAELHEIFSVFDRDGDGMINRAELLEALEIDQDLLAPALETSRENWADSVRRIERAKSGGLTKEDIDHFYHEYDKNSDDLLDFDEFVKLMEVAAA